MAYTDHEIYALRQRVDRLERQVAFLVETLGVVVPDEPDQGVSPEVMDLVRSGKKIQAIRRFREETGADLKSAKAIIESLEG